MTALLVTAIVAVAVEAAVIVALVVRLRRINDHDGHRRGNAEHG